MKNITKYIQVNHEFDFYFEIGPGPRYMLKTLIGFDDHDPSRFRYPAYSMRIRPKAKLVSTGPGPYPVPGNFTRHGPEIPPAYTMVFKPKQTGKHF